MNTGLLHHAFLLVSILLVLGCWLRTRHTGRLSWGQAPDMRISFLAAMVAFDRSLPAEVSVGETLLINFLFCYLVYLALRQVAALAPAQT